jgi:hypothetical protein
VSHDRLKTEIKKKLSLISRAFRCLNSFSNISFAFATKKKLFHLRKNTFFICCFTFCILPSSNLNQNNSEKCINYIYIFNTMMMHCWVNVLIILINCPSFCLQCKLLSTKKKKKFEFVESHFLSMSMEKNKNRNLFYTRLFGELFIIQIWKTVND